jgi:hypothetical protein
VAKLAKYQWKAEGNVIKQSCEFSKHSYHQKADGKNKILLPIHPPNNLFQLCHQPLKFQSMFLETSSIILYDFYCVNMFLCLLESWIQSLTLVLTSLVFLEKGVYEKKVVKHWSILSCLLKSNNKVDHFYNHLQLRCRVVYFFKNTNKKNFFKWPSFEFQVQ